MKTFLFLVLLIPTIAFGDLVCPLIDGCPIKKGECVGCIIKTNHQHYQQDSLDTERSNTQSKPSIIKPQRIEKKSRCYWKCVVGPCDKTMLPDGCTWLSQRE